MPRPVRWTHFRPQLARARFDRRKGTAQQASDYCNGDEHKKEGDVSQIVGGPYIFGRMSGGSGARTDLLKLRDAVRDGKRGRALFDDDDVAGSAIKYQRGVAALTEAYSKPTERGDIRVTLHVGPPGTGKTHCAHSDDVCILAILGVFFVVLTHFIRHITMMEIRGASGSGMRAKRKRSSMSLGVTPCVPLSSSEWPTSILSGSMSKVDKYLVTFGNCTSAVTSFPSSGGVKRPKSTWKQSTVVYL